MCERERGWVRNNERGGRRERYIESDVGRDGEGGYKEGIDRL